MTRLRAIAAALTAFLALLAWAGAAAAYDQTAVDKADLAAQGYSTDLSAIDKNMQLTNLSDSQLTEYRGKIEDIRAGASTLSETLVQPLADLMAQLKLLPPPPAANAPPEAPAVADQRAKLTEQLNHLQGIKSQLDLAAGTAEQLASRASALQRNLFLTRVFEGGRSVLNPVLWRDTTVGSGLFLTRLAASLATWWTIVSATANFTMLLLIPAMLLLVAGLILLLRRSMRDWMQRVVAGNRTPSDFERTWRVMRAFATGCILAALLFGPIYLALRVGGFTTPRFDMAYLGVADVVATTVLYWLLTRRLVAPGQAAWRIVDISDSAATQLPPLVGVLAFVSAFASSTGTIADGLYLPVTFTIGQSALSALIMLLLQAVILYILRNQQGIGARLPGRSLYFTWAGVLAPLLWLLIAAGLVALLFGYVALASYVAEQITDTVVIGIVLVLLHHLTDLAVAVSFDPQSGLGRVLRRATGFGERSIERLGLLARIVVDVVLVLIGLPLMFVQWAVTWVDFRSLANSALIGFKLGTITISPGLIIAVVLALAGGILLTNLLVRWLDNRILSETRLDKGVQDSLRKGVSYAGYALAGGLALSSAGVDLSTLTLVFGALGVGIGFGLQAIVNNFISGLILLAERPIRVGDWVVLDAGEGLVKRINVRSTQIETFDNCTMFVPNLSLITGVVKNWTHGDTMGRFGIHLTVDYGSDVELVRNTLLDVTKAHPKVLTFPEPVVFLQSFGMRGFDFEIKGAVADVFYASYVATDLRFAILKAFAEKSIKLADPIAMMQLQPAGTVGRK